MRSPKPLLRDEPHSSKKDFGHLLVFAGSSSMLGASCLVSLAAIRSGAGLVTCAIPKELNLTLQKKISPVIMTLPFEKYIHIKEKFSYFNSLAIGPGLGRIASIGKVVLNLILDYDHPMVIDADALNFIAVQPNVLQKVKSPKILTPHTGEMARLTGLSVSCVEKNRRQVALDFAVEYKCILILKGHHTIVADPLGGVYINRSGNAGMAKAGMGDVLTGMIGGLLAQGVPAIDASRYGVFWHGKIGDTLALKQNRSSFIATDMIEELKGFMC